MLRYSLGSRTVVSSHIISVARLNLILGAQSANSLDDAQAVAEQSNEMVKELMNGASSRQNARTKLGPTRNRT